jgi:hypothetical protein
MHQGHVVFEDQFGGKQYQAITEKGWRKEWRRTEQGPLRGRDILPLQRWFLEMKTPAVWLHSPHKLIKNWSLLGGYFL